MKIVKALTLVSLLNKESDFFLKSNKQDGAINKKSLLMTSHKK